MKTEWGIAMQPCVVPITEQLWQMVNPDQEFNYLEIGVAEAKTMAGVGRYLETITDNFNLFGVDIEEGWSLDREAIRRNLDGFSHAVSFLGSKAFLASVAIGCPELFDFVVVDGCHGEACALSDLGSVYPRLRRGGVACFHDSDVACQGLDVQPHCGQPIQVRAALIRAGLLDGANKDWLLLRDVDGGAEGRGCVMIQKL